MEEKRLKLIKILLKALLKVNVSLNKFAEFVNDNENPFFYYIEPEEQLIPTEEIGETLGIRDEEELDKLLYCLNECDDEKKIDKLIENLIKEFNI